MSDELRTYTITVDVTDAMDCDDIKAQFRKARAELTRVRGNELAEAHARRLALPLQAGTILLSDWLAAGTPPPAEAFKRGLVTPWHRDDTEAQPA